MKRPMTPSPYGAAQPPRVNPPRVSSSAPPGACITPSSVTWLVTTILAMWDSSSTVELDGTVLIGELDCPVLCPPREPRRQGRPPFGPQGAGDTRSGHLGLSAQR